MNWPEDYINKIHCADCLGFMKKMPDESIDMCMTSPPYYGLRDYGLGERQLGLEHTPEMYVEHLTEIFNEVKRVLKKEGTLWIVIGDTYGGSCQGGGDTGLSKERHRKELLTYTNKPQRKLMPKCLLMVPERLAWSLIQNDRDDDYEMRNDLTPKEKEYVLSELKKYRCHEDKNHNDR